MASDRTGLTVKLDEDVLYACPKCAAESPTGRWELLDMGNLQGPTCAVHGTLPRPNYWAGHWASTIPPQK